MSHVFLNIPRVRPENRIYFYFAEKFRLRPIGCNLYSFYHLLSYSINLFVKYHTVQKGTKILILFDKMEPPIRKWMQNVILLSKTFCLCCESIVSCAFGFKACKKSQYEQKKTFWKKFNSKRSFIF